MDGDAWWYPGGGGGGGSNNWDLGAVVRFGCGGGRVSPAAALLGEAWEYDDDPFSSFLAPPMTAQQAALPAVWEEGDDGDAAWMAPLPGLQTGGGWGDQAPMVVDELCGALVVAPPPPPKQQEVLQVQQQPPPADNTQPTTYQQGSGGDGESTRAGGSRSARRKYAASAIYIVSVCFSDSCIMWIRSLADDRGVRHACRKKQTRKEVVRVAASGPAPDLWAWRKYGQKPIKGSPYPRGYYRCSSNKNCAARKQVERCRLDPSFLLLTYTGAHSGHDVPLHRNSLAGTTRHKPPPPPPLPSAADKSPATAAEAATASQSPGLSPTTPLRASSMELHGEDDAEAELQVEEDDMAIDDEDDDDVADETISTVPWGTPISDAIIAASYEWR
uniref:WRKY transcription factor WRKY51 n=1 Tax=Oryza rufipogon TaxID=4529 RepID=A0A0E0PYD8_ORYRU